MYKQKLKQNCISRIYTNKQMPIKSFTVIWTFNLKNLLFFVGTLSNN